MATSTPSPNPSGLSPRRAALDLLEGVFGEGRLLSEFAARRLEGLPPQEAARARRLALQTLRHADRADRLLGPHLRKRPPPRIHAILRLGIVEMFEEGGAAHAVVHDCVALAQEGRGGRARGGLVNAVLRRVSGRPEAWAALGPSRMPKWLRRPLLKHYGKAAVSAMEAVHAEVPPLDLTLRDPSGAKGWARRLGGVALPGGSVRLAGNADLRALEGFAEGSWWVQDFAAALPVRMLASRRGMRVLDICAAPGGKTMQLAAAGAEVTALDISERRLARLEENLARTGLEARIVCADALAYEAAPFDAVLLDAPCSATGTIRRHPDLPHAKRPEGIAPLHDLQARLLERALDLLKPGGRLVYCTCSLLPEEGEAQIEALMARRGDLAHDPALPAGASRAWQGPQGLRTRPDFMADRGGMDGFFMARLRKAG